MELMVHMIALTSLTSKSTQTMLNTVHKLNTLHIYLCSLYTVAIEHYISALLALVLFLITPDLLNTSICSSNFDWGRAAFLVWQGIALENACTNYSGIMFYLAFHHYKTLSTAKVRMFNLFQSCLHSIYFMSAVHQTADAITVVLRFRLASNEASKTDMNIQMIKVSVVRDNSHNQ